ncbi:DUF4352 domain-containing protein [Paenibacillus sp. CGMCC 1.16610]|uniref:DUF4352 domain-containing protein n=1 Tax=Paenibacillus anseongense TaxID=2682845 RepID=A0ABW9U4L2_9BACL|nr:MULTISPECIES: DUF4352 domain-containing protein [Paenibacillus]MBA2939075.1 DUF4352 domain-containing protein [Paenibacillus sp. CGMCC 1.16610]MVQ35034.1 DUF4352 domain-containing protein [Paenibacillus anseongense]
MKKLLITAITITSSAIVLSACTTESAYKNLENQKPVQQAITASTPAPTATPAPTPTPPKLIPKGESGTIGSFELKVLKNTATNKVDKKTTDNQFILIDIELKNVGKKPETMMDGNFVLIDDKDRQYKANSLDILPWSGEYKMLSYDPINPDLKKSGTIAFEIPADVTRFGLAVRDNMFDFGGAKYIFFEVQS